MRALVLLVVVGYVGIGAIELPGLWGKPHRRGELWAVLVLLGVGLVLAIIITMGYRPISVWRIIEAIFRPIGEPLFKPEGE